LLGDPKKFVHRERNLLSAALVLVSVTVPQKKKYIYIYIYIYLFIYLFVATDAGSSSEHTVSNERMLKEMIWISSENDNEET